MVKFAVIPDAHLGYRQHGLEERREDFLKAFWECIIKALEDEVRFIIIAGDLFHTRSPDWYDIKEAFRAFQYAAWGANTPIVVIRGNHDAPSYTDRIGWDDLFSELDVVKKPPYSYYDYDSHKTFNVHGINWQTDLNETLRSYPVYNHNSENFNILTLHGGIDNMLYHDKAQVSMETLNSLKDKFNMIFLGHIHKPYSIDNWIYSPGSLENVSVAETQWPERGMLIVEVQDNFEYEVKTFVPERRKIKTLEHDIHNMEYWLRFINNEKLKLEESMIFLTLTGVVDNPVTTEYLSSIETRLKGATKALFVKIKNQTTLPDEPDKLGEEISVDKAYEFVFGDKADRAKTIKDDLVNKRKLDIKNL